MIVYMSMYAVDRQWGNDKEYFVLWLNGKGNAPVPWRFRSQNNNSHE
jgi:hypothetical protein